MKTAFSQLKKYFSENAGFIRGALVVGVGLLVFTQIAFVAQKLATTAQTRSIVAASDDDAAAAIEVALRTHLLNDNHWNPYGPVYYRISAFLGYFFDGVALDSSLSPIEQKEQTRHFLLMLVSLFCVVGTALLFAFVFTGEWFYRLAITYALSAAFLSDPTRLLFIFRAHPDHLLVLGVAAALLATLKFMASQTDSDLKKMASLWGLTTSIKMTTTLFGPSVLLALVPWSKKRLGKFLGYAFATYLLVGFPQNFDVFGPIKFLIKQSKYIVRADGTSLAGWWELFLAQLTHPLPMILIITLIFGASTLQPLLQSRALYVRSLLVLTLSTLVLLSRKILSSFDYYPMPFVISLLWLAVLLMLPLHLKIKKLLFNKSSLVSKSQSVWVQIAVLVILTIAVRPVSPVMMAIAADENICRSEARQIELWIAEKAQGGGTIIVDPYVPYRPELTNVKKSWSTTFAKLNELQATHLVLNESYYARYNDEHQTKTGGTLHVDNLSPVTEFYLAARGMTFTDKNGYRWVREPIKLCTWQLWQRQTPTPTKKK